MLSDIGLEELRAIVAQALELSPEEVGDSDHFAEDLEMDSLMLLEISSRVEKECGVSIEDSSLASVQTLTELHGLVGSLQADGSAA